MSTRRLLVCMQVMALSGSAFCQQVTITLADKASGRGIEGQPVTVSPIYRTFAERPKEIPPFFSGKTNGAGELIITLPTPVPESLSIMLKPESRLWKCGCLTTANTQQILLQGAVVDPAIEYLSDKDAKPGHLRFIAQKTSFWERLLYPLTKY